MASTNEHSTRYSEAIDAAQRTSPAAWRMQATDNRQGSGSFLEDSLGEHLSQREVALQEMARQVYQERLAQGVAREQARKDLPLCTYTEAYWKIDLHNLLHFLSLRMEAHAQEEIRAYANIIGYEIVRRWCPLAWEAFQDYRLASLALSRLEIALIAAFESGKSAEAVRIAQEAGWLKEDGSPKRNHRELAEFYEKLDSLGLSCPWRSHQ